MNSTNHAAQSADSPAADLLIEGHPNWPAIDFEVTCARCGYNLRMLTAPRCTECGLEFEWPLVLRQATSQSDFLFEHQWRRRPIRSFFATAWRSFRPRSFWQKVSIYDRISIPPLICLIVSAALGYLCALVALAAVIVTIHHAARGTPITATAVAIATGVSRPVRISFDALLPGSNLVVVGLHPLAVGLALVSVGSICLAGLVICAMRQTLGRCKVRTTQVLRIIAYIANPVCLFWVVIVLLAFGINDLTPPATRSTDKFETSLFLGAVGAHACVFAWFLTAGLRYYLKIPNAVRLGVGATVIAIFLTFSFHMGRTLLGI